MNDQSDENLTPKQAAAILGHGRGFIMALIRAGELAARDERRPGATRPRWRISMADLEAWRVSRRVPQLSEPERRLLTMPRLPGVLDARLAAIRARKNRDTARLPRV